MSSPFPLLLPEEELVNHGPGDRRESRGLLVRAGLGHARVGVDLQEVGQLLRLDPVLIGLTHTVPCKYPHRPGDPKKRGQECKPIWEFVLVQRRIGGVETEVGPGNGTGGIDHTRLRYQQLSMR